jgi:chromosome segregation ATPase
MAKQTINIGTNANSKDGDIIRDAFNKVNQNFDEIYEIIVLDGGTASTVFDDDNNIDGGGA